MKTTCDKCGFGVRMERGAHGIEAYQCRACGYVMVAGADAKKSRSKYGNERVEVDGITFDSKLESRRWHELKAMEQAGCISNLRRQVPYLLQVNGMLICTYVADFVYLEKVGDVKNGAPLTVLVSAEVVEDSKGHKTPEYRLKKKMMRAIHGIDIRETGANGKKISPKG